MKLKTSILLIGITAALTGCNEADRSQQTKTVGWFLDHRDELAVALNACGDNPGEFAKTPNCINRMRPATRLPSKRWKMP
jgi:hypothetical protein